MPREFASTWQRRMQIVLTVGILLSAPAHANSDSGTPAKTLRDVLTAPDKVEAVFFTILHAPSKEASEIPVPALAAGFITTEDETTEAAAQNLVLRMPTSNSVSPGTIRGVWHPRNRGSETRLTMPAGFLPEHSSAGALLLLGRRHVPDEWRFS